MCALPVLARPVLRQRPVLVLGAALLAGLSACGAPVTAPSPERILILVNASANEDRPGLTTGIAGLVQRAVATDRATLDVVVDGPSGPAPAASVDLVLRRGTQVEHAEQRRTELAGQVLDRVRAAVAQASGASGQVDTLGQLTYLARLPGELTGVVIGSGLQTAGPLAIDALGWDQVGSASIVDRAKAAGLLPDLRGKTVVFSGLGDVTGAQAALPESLRQRLASHWLNLCTAAGGRCSIDDEPLSGPPRSEVAAPVTAVPAEPALAVPAHGEPAVTILPSDLLFGPDSAALLPQARTTLAGIAARLPAGSRVALDGRTATAGPADTARALSLTRAQACRDVLVAAGIPADRITVRGLGFDAPLVPDTDAQGRLVPAAAQRNRSVVLTVTPGGAP
ncbi:hypothetical protein GCM10009836_15470 [Pseudonocardia ailaonensis]|uniref:OmpA-like domain-containing protein n=1 Tax=Pseudonocardia ailaonensis TaxID=367279 RepID=A0ABN2MSY6_9PSEU